MQYLLEGKPDTSVIGLTGHRSAPACGRRLLPRAPSETSDRPSGQNFRELLHILLRIPAIDTERVELEKLARVVLVEPPALALPAAAQRGTARGRPDRLKVVEIYEHRGMLRRRENHVFEPAEDMRPNGFALVTAGEGHDQHLGAHRHTQMIGPERDEALDKRSFGDDALREHGVALGRRDADKGAPRPLTSLLSFLLVAHANRAKRADGICNGARRPFRRCNRQRDLSLQLRAKPTLRVGHAPAFAGASTESEAVERPKRGIHDIDLNSIRRQTTGPYTWS